MVIDINCLECNREAGPTLVVATNDREEAILAATKERPSREYDMFVVDTHTQTFIEPNSENY